MSLGLILGSCTTNKKQKAKSPAMVKGNAVTKEEEIKDLMVKNPDEGPLFDQIQIGNRVFPILRSDKYKAYWSKI
jgi:hypothetical protein